MIHWVVLKHMFIWVWDILMVRFQERLLYRYSKFKYVCTYLELLPDSNMAAIHSNRKKFYYEYVIVPVNY